MRAIALLGITLFLNVTSTEAAQEGREIHWRSGPARLSAGTAALDLAAKAGNRHVVVQFRAPLSEDDRKAVKALGIRLGAYVGADAYFAALPVGGDTIGLRALPSLHALEGIRPEWKLHPQLLAGDVPEFAIVESSKKGRVAAVYVVFHGDVDLKGEGLPLIKQLGGKVRSTMSVVNGAVVELPEKRIPELAADDRVQWVEPPLPLLQENNFESAVVIEAREPQAPAARYPYNLDGTEITVMVYDGGTAQATHEAFAPPGRLVIGELIADPKQHPTHVAGTIGSNGSNTRNNRHAGMAPNVSMVSYATQGSGNGGLHLYTDPGDLEADYRDAIDNHGANIANNSIGLNIERTGLDCLMQGDYGVTDQLIDGIVRGGLGSPFRVVWANGNERFGTQQCNVEGHGAYYSIAPPSGAKNHIAVGALNSPGITALGEIINDGQADTMTSFSSWGPTDDGRMKPDVSAPGCQNTRPDCDPSFPVNNECGVQSATTSVSNDEHALVYCGTSQAAPVVTGALALLLQDYRADFLEPHPLPRNSTLKVLLAQTAVDLGNVGPDYQAGYGSIRIKQAIDQRRANGFRESDVTQGARRSYDVIVPSGTAELKVTIAWDDSPGCPNTSGASALINDLDVIARAPDGTVHYPWTLDPSDPASPAVRTTRNIRDNIEQVLVDNPAAGTWSIEVTGYNVPEGPQSFSITASGALSPTPSSADWQRTPRAGFTTSCVNASGPVSKPTLCPQGDLPQVIEVTLFDEDGAPIAQVPAEDIVATGSCRLLTTAGTDVCGPLDAQGKPTTWVNTVQADADTDASGRTTITLVGAIGACSDLQIEALGVTLATLSFRSVDFTPLTGLTTASGILTSSEFNAITNSIGRTDRDWMDFNCTGIIDSGDYNFFMNGHIGHKCRP